MRSYFWEKGIGSMNNGRSMFGVGHWLTSLPGTIIVQPTSWCPLACTYCYLPQRHLKQDMSPSVAAAIAAGIEPDWPPVEVVWHGGEPLAVGPRRLAALLAPFEPLRRAGRVQHMVQTGATLISDAWYELFERYEVGVGVSIDGPRLANRHRVDRAGRPMFDRIVAGIETLKRHGIPFTVLAVVSRDGTHRAVEVLDFLRDLGCRWVGFNIEAKEGANAGRHYTFWTGKVGGRHQPDTTRQPCIATACCTNPRPGGSAPCRSCKPAPARSRSSSRSAATYG
jgi:uncharacterized protein